MDINSIRSFHSELEKVSFWFKKPNVGNRWKMAKRSLITGGAVLGAGFGALSIHEASKSGDSAVANVGNTIAPTELSSMPHDYESGKYKGITTRGPSSSFGTSV